MSLFLNRIIHGDCKEVLAQLPDECVDLIITSPPYADCAGGEQRAKV
ncbi:MAG: hypothetical protein NZ874_06510 [Fimbriimonadales bacterium]|nr:hypothetical protein [Fimbriimonadales bacterium]